jgi:hypothetical protein
MGEMDTMDGPARLTRRAVLTGTDGVATLAGMNAMPLTPNTVSFRKGGGTAFLLMDAVYLLMVFGWTVFLPPLGRDYAGLANFAPFGDSAVAYHAVNMALLYLAMVLVFFLTRLATGGPWWLGSVAAVMFMAHPLKAEAVLNLCGMKDLFPAILSLAALLAYGLARRKPGWVVSCLTAVLFAGACLPVSGQGGLLFAVLAWEGSIVPREQRRWNIVPSFLGIAVLGWFLHPPALAGAPLSLTGVFWPMVYLPYPMGLLPENAATLGTQPFLPAIMFAGLALAAFWLARTIRHPAFTFGLLAAAGLAVFGENRVVDPVHLIGGGRMLPAIALFAIALAGAFHRMIHHPAWPKPTVWVTSILCLTLMIMQVQVNLAWNRAATAVYAFRQAAFTAGAQHPGERLAVFPDFRYCDGAPVQFAESVRHTTPFGRAFPVEVIAAYDPDTLDPGAFSLLEYDAKGAAFAATVRGPFSVTGPNQKRLTPANGMHWTWFQWLAPRDMTVPKVTDQVRVVPDGQPFPETRIAFPR